MAERADVVAGRAPADRSGMDGDQPAGPEPPQRRGAQPRRDRGPVPLQRLEQAPLAIGEALRPVKCGGPGFGELGDQGVLGARAGGRAGRQHQGERPRAASSSTRSAIQPASVDEIGRDSAGQHGVGLGQAIGIELRGPGQPDHDAERRPAAEGNPQQRADLDLTLIGPQAVVERADHGPGPRQGLNPRDHGRRGEDSSKAWPWRG